MSATAPSASTASTTHRGDSEDRVRRNDSSEGKRSLSQGDASDAGWSVIGRKRCLERRSSALSMGALPLVALAYIGCFAKGRALSATCRTALEALRELHYKINVKEHAPAFSLTQDHEGDASKSHMGLLPSGALATGRAIVRITITGCSDYKTSHGGYQILETAIKRVVYAAGPTLRSICVKGNRGKDSGRVAALIGELVPNACVRRRVAPHLTRVELGSGANGVVKVGRAAQAGLWPSLEELEIPDCHANAGHMRPLAEAIMAGRLPHLRVLNWNNQACSKEGVDDFVLSALATGKCPCLQRVSFTDNAYSSEVNLAHLRPALEACPELRDLRMDCTMTPRVQLHDLTVALRGSRTPRLTSLYVRFCRSPFSFYHDHQIPSEEDIRALRAAAVAHDPPISYFETALMLVM